MGILRGVLTVALTLFAIGAFAQPAGDTTLNIIEKGRIKYHLQDGRNQLNWGDHRAALKAFREVLQVDPENVMAQFSIAEAYYLLKRYPLAKKYVDKVAESDLKKKQIKEYKLLKGKIYHRSTKFDEALGYLNKYKELAKKQEIIDSEVDRYIAQCQYAKEAMKSKVDVKIENAGDNINSKNPEYSPSITPDGKTMIFTSRRADTKGG